MLDQLEKFNLMEMGVQSYSVLEDFRHDSVFLQSIFEAGIQQDGLILNLPLIQVVEMFRQLREFLIVEYLNLLNQPISESIVHNTGFYVTETGDKYRSFIELEYWAGTEGQDGKAKFLGNSTLATLIYEIELLQTVDLKRVAMFKVLRSLFPIAKAIDFMNSSFFYTKDKDGRYKENAKRAFRHFDIKPQNVFSRKIYLGETHPLLEKSLVLADFGISYKGVASGGRVFGTEEYVAPELFNLNSSSQHRSEITVSRVDIYSFGVMLFEVIVGDLPSLFTTQRAKGEPDTFWTTNGMDLDLVKAETNLLIDDSDRQAMKERGIDKDNDIDDIVQILSKAMSIDPRYRFRSCEDMMRELNEVIKYMPEQIRV